MQHASTAKDKTILVAVRPRDVPQVTDVLGSEFSLVITHSMEDAVAELDERIGFVACGVHFDSGRMFDLLRHVKSHAPFNALPFYILLGSGRYSPQIMHGIRSAAKLMGASGFTDLSVLRETYGDQAYARMRQVVREALSGPGNDVLAGRPVSEGSGQAHDR
ncbi:hypothetical protein [Noviherbaspirillum galbum]|uniref:Uncharacterized protein n=1 Tax=Noviherbaspirillum galbum TaxID=2709383 RepID=A0A6B3SYN5_9BURK|nr:hypothetical protein [Noviherbaspirillum galbum]NEX63912.1 hypothetical protein [Noviherbaspirillum galbum]